MNGSEWEREQQRLERRQNANSCKPFDQSSPKTPSGKEIEMPRWRLNFTCSWHIFVYLQNISATLGVGCQKCYAKSPKREGFWTCCKQKYEYFSFTAQLTLSLWQDSMLDEPATLQVVKFVCIRINLLGVLLNKIQAGERWRAEKFFANKITLSRIKRLLRNRRPTNKFYFLES